MNIMNIRTFESDGKKIHIIDNVFNIFQREIIIGNLQSLKFVLGYGDLSPPDRKIFISGVDNDLTSQIPFFIPKINEIYSKVYPNQEFYMHRPIVNVVHSGNKMAIHGDSEINSVSAVFHAGYEWDMHDGGDNYFFTDDASEISQAVLYKPNRLLLFDSRIPHGVSPVTSNKVRFTFACIYSKSESSC